jgi:hypothetical protein
MGNIGSILESYIGFPPIFHKKLLVHQKNILNPKMKRKIRYEHWCPKFSDSKQNEWKMACTQSRGSDL